MPTGTGRLDEFASLFRSALKDGFQLQRPALASARLVTDLDPARSAELLVHTQRCLSGIDQAEQVSWSVWDRTQWADGAEPPIPRLLARLEAEPTDLVVTYRHLLGAMRDLPHTLGSVVDTLTQAIATPVLLLPSPDREDFEQCLRGTDRVAVITDHLVGHDSLVSWAVHVTHTDGTLYLVHIEDQEVLDRYLDVIGKLPGIDSGDAERRLPDKLLEQPRDYIEAVRAELVREQIREELVPVVRMGLPLRGLADLVAELGIDMLVIQTKDPGQQAMEALAHALAVEVRHRPLLLL